MFAEAQESLGASSDRRLQRAVQHVNMHWFPVNESVLESVRKGLSEGAYELDPSFLFRELKEDFALLSFCVKELQLVAQRERIPDSISNDPFRLVQWAGPARIRDILCTGKAISTHSLSSNEEYQDARLRETAVSASTTEILSEANDLDGEHGFTHCVVRQVGLNLIAWNYPTVYARALKGLTPRTTIDSELTKALGFSPSLLATVVMRPKQPDLARIPADLKDTWGTLDELCRVGEALARANDPETYPSAEQDWSTARTSIEKHLGSRGVELIHERIVENTARYRVACPEAFSPAHSFNPVVALSRHKDGALSQNNPFLKQCPESLRTDLKEIYRSLSRQGVTRETIAQLLKEILPKHGFSGALVYLIDPTRGVLFPQVKIGTVNLRASAPIEWKRPAAMDPLLGEALTTKNHLPTDMVAAAFECDMPLVEQGPLTENGQSFVSIAGVVGKERRVGVMYVELAANNVDSGPAGTLTIYKALRQTLADALKVQ